MGASVGKASGKIKSAYNTVMNNRQKIADLYNAAINGSMKAMEFAANAAILAQTTIDTVMQLKSGLLNSEVDKIDKLRLISEAIVNINSLLNTTRAMKVKATSPEDKQRLEQEEANLIKQKEEAEKARLEVQNTAITTGGDCGIENMSIDDNPDFFDSGDGYGTYGGNDFLNTDSIGVGIIIVIIIIFIALYMFIYDPISSYIAGGKDWAYYVVLGGSIGIIATYLYSISPHEPKN